MEHELTWDEVKAWVKAMPKGSPCGDPMGYYDSLTCLVFRDKYGIQTKIIVYEDDLAILYPTQVGRTKSYPLRSDLSRLEDTLLRRAEKDRRYVRGQHRTREYTLRVMREMERKAA